MRRPERSRSSEPPSSEEEGPSSSQREGQASPRRERGSAATQERILDAAEREFAAHGFAGARLREIASGASIQPALIHHYFADKQGLYESVVRRAVDQMSIASWRVLEKERDLEGLARGFVEVLVDFSETHCQLIAMVRGELLAGSGLLVDIVREKTQPILEAVVKLTEQLQKSGELRSDVEARDIVRSGLSLILYPVVEAAVLDLLLPDPEPEKAAARRKRVITAVLLAGVRATRG